MSVTSETTLAPVRLLTNTAGNVEKTFILNAQTTSDLSANKDAKQALIANEA